MASHILPLATVLTLVSGAYSSPVIPSAPRAVVVDNASQLRAEYDYVLIGGGTSSLVVANRLTEDTSVNVLVIEYGYVDGGENGTTTPGLPVPSKYERNYVSVPQLGLDNRTAPLYTGAVVGGGTVVNGMFFHRGSAGEYDAWENLGNPGWGWKDLLPYFKKSETFTPPSKEIQDSFPGIISTDLTPHGTQGPISSSFSNFQYPVIHNFFRGWNSIGLKTTPQPNNGDANGAFYGPVSLKAANQSRSSAADGYYRPIVGKRSNFHLITGQTVSKINFNKQKVATSVNFVSRNATNGQGATTIKACREVILAAGAPRSPQVLQLSGIGPKKLLAQYGIDAVVDLPGVGQNFQDQPAMYIQYSYGTDYPFPTPDWIQSNASWNADQLTTYIRNRTGPITIPYYSGSIVAFLPLLNTTTNAPSILSAISTTNLSSIPYAKSADPTVQAGYEAQLAQQLNLYKSTKSSVLEVAWAGGNTVSVAIIRPLSRGTMNINSTNPNAAPVVDFGTFSNPVDLTLAVESLKKVRQWTASGPMQEIEAVETYPGLSVSSDVDIAKAIRGLATSSWQHPTSTCAMLPRRLGGVVDAQLRVYGVKNLRIVDASVMPMVVAGHTSATVYAVAEKAADIIKASWQ